MSAGRDVTTPADLIDELINAAQRVGCGDGTVSRVVALRAEVLALVIGDDPTRDAAIKLCRDMAAWCRSGSVGNSPLLSSAGAAWEVALDMLAKGWRP